MTLKSLKKVPLPAVSVIIPVYNAEGSLSMCLESIQNLDYPREKLQVIVVDNGSSDQSIKIAETFNTELLHETSIQSSYGARNKGITRAKGELIAFTDSDCIVSPGWLKNLVSFWEDKSIGCFAGEILAYQPKTLVEKFSDRAGILKQKGTLNNSYMPYTQTANSAYRKEIFDRIGLFNSDLISGGDADLSWRMQEETDFRIKFIPEAVVYHKHRTSIIGLYKQFKKYEHGKLLWAEYYPDYKLPSVEQRKSELWRDIHTLKSTLLDNFKKLIRRQIDSVAFFTPFLRVVISLGTYRGRISKLK